MNYLKHLAVLLTVFSITDSFAQTLRPNCDGHGGTIYAQVSWDLATRRSDCQSGLGFRCGTHGIILCADGSGTMWKGAPSGFANPGLADISFVSNRQVGRKMLLEFAEAPNLLPSDDKKIFEVGENSVIENTSGARIDGNVFRQIIILAGDYVMEYSQSRFGRVYVDYQIVY